MPGPRSHFIGHLQTNKVKQVVGKAALIHSVDSQRLLQAIDSQAGKLGLVQDILLEVNIAGEESKGGCTPQEAEELAALGGGDGPCAPAGADGHPSGFSGAWGQPPVFCGDASAFC